MFFAAGPLDIIIPGLTAAGICPLTQSNPQVVINAIATGSVAAFNQGTAAQTDYATALGAAISASATSGCIDTFLELVNKGIIIGGKPSEVVVGRALAKGAAGGVGSATGKVLATATAAVICRGGETASACARAWAQAIELDPNGCEVLVTAYAEAKASCGPGFATAQARSFVFIEPLGVCKAPDFTRAAADLTIGDFSLDDD